MLGFGLIGHAQGIVCEGSIIVLAQLLSIHCSGIAG